MMLRALALLIAAAAFVDPEITSRRGVRPEISVIAATPADGAQSARIADDLSRRYEVRRFASPTAVAAVVVGDTLPSSRDLITSPVVGIPASAPLRITGVSVPASAQVGSAVHLTAAAHMRGLRGRRVSALLRANGVAVDRSTLTPRADDDSSVVTLGYIASAAGVARLTVELTEGSSSATADVAVNVLDQRRAVLFYDTHASWMSTFVRRAAERDARLAVTSRVLTSRNITRDVGAPPPQLDAATTSAFDAIVVGAPASLSSADVDGLDRFMRRRGGTVVLLLDERIVPAPLARLSGAVRWDSASVAAANAFVLRGDDSASTRATDAAFPETLPAGGTLLYGAGNRPLIWRVPVGAGELIVSGALDAWRYRDAGFERFWQGLIARAASNALPALSLSATPTVTAPGQPIDVALDVRDVALAGEGAVTVSATLGDSAFRLWPSSSAGQFRGSVRAPGPGTYELTATVNGVSTSAPIIVAADAQHARPSSSRLLRSWVASRGGIMLDPQRQADVASAIEQVRVAGVAAEPWHPMRSAWWMLPFALALAGEWWLRRRRGMK